MANIIKIKRGLSSDINTAVLELGELAITTDTSKLYVGSATGVPQPVVTLSKEEVQEMIDVTTGSNYDGNLSKYTTKWAQQDISSTGVVVGTNHPKDLSTVPDLWVRQNISSSGAITTENGSGYNASNVMLVNPITDTVTITIPTGILYAQVLYNEDGSFKSRGSWNNGPSTITWSVDSGSQNFTIATQSTSNLTKEEMLAKFTMTRPEGYEKSAISLIQKEQEPMTVEVLTNTVEYAIVKYDSNGAFVEKSAWISGIASSVVYDNKPGYQNIVVRSTDGTAVDIETLLNRISIVVDVPDVEYATKEYVDTSIENRVGDTSCESIGEYTFTNSWDEWSAYGITQTEDYYSEGWSFEDGYIYVDIGNHSSDGYYANAFVDNNTDKNIYFKVEWEAFNDKQSNYFESSDLTVYGGESVVINSIGATGELTGVLPANSTGLELFSAMGDWDDSYGEYLHLKIYFKPYVQSNEVKGYIDTLVSNNNVMLEHELIPEVAATQIETLRPVLDIPRAGTSESVPYITYCGDKVEWKAYIWDDLPAAGGSVILEEDMHRTSEFIPVFYCFTFHTTGSDNHHIIMAPNKDISIEFTRAIASSGAAVPCYQLKLTTAINLTSYRGRGFIGWIEADTDTYI